MITTVLFKTDKKLKEKVQRHAKKMGLPLGTVMNRMMEQFAENPQLTFSAKPLTPTPYLRRILEQGEKDLKTGKGIKRFSSVDEMFDDLERRIAKKK